MGTKFKKNKVYMFSLAAYCEHSRISLDEVPQECWQRKCDCLVVDASAKEKAFGYEVGYVRAAAIDGSLADYKVIASWCREV